MKTDYSKGKIYKITKISKLFKIIAVPGVTGPIFQECSKYNWFIPFSQPWD